jgi:hypothetical protein
MSEFKTVTFCSNAHAGPGSNAVAAALTAFQALSASPLSVELLSVVVNCPAQQKCKDRSFALATTDRS